MPQANDGALTRLITVQTGGTVEDTAPNQPQPGSPTAETSFDLLLEGVAGNALGHNGATYTLTITAFDVTAGGNNGPMSLPPQSQAFTSANWKPFPAATPTEYVTDQRFNIPVPPGVSGHMFRYSASLVSSDFDEAWLIEGVPFVLV